MMRRESRIRWPSWKTWPAPGLQKLVASKDAFQPVSLTRVHPESVRRFRNESERSGMSSSEYGMNPGHCGSANCPAYAPPPASHHALWFCTVRRVLARPDHPFEGLLPEANRTAVDRVVLDAIGGECGAPGESQDQASQKQQQAGGLTRATSAHVFLPRPQGDCPENACWLADISLFGEVTPAT